MVDDNEELRGKAVAQVEGVKGGSKLFLIVLAQYRTVFDSSYHFTARAYRVTKYGSVSEALDFSGPILKEEEIVVRRINDASGYVT